MGDEDQGGDAGEPETVDEQRFPLTVQAGPDLVDAHTDAGFEDGLQVILAGLRARYLQKPR